MAVEKKFVREAVGRLLIKEFLRKETERAGFGGIDIQRTPMGTRVSIIAERPGMVIGRKGSTINALTSDLDRRFKVENPQIEVIEAGHDANLNAQIMAHKLAEALERGWHFRRAGHSTVQRVMGSGAQGCQVIVSGKLTGQRHRTEKFSQGHIKYCGETADRVMDVGFAVAKKKLGVIGCTVRIMRAEHRLPDNIKIRDAVPAPSVPAAPPAEVKPEAKSPAKAPAAKKAPAKRTRAPKKETPPEEPKAAAVAKPAKKEEKETSPKKEAPAEEPKAAAVAQPAKKEEKATSPKKETPAEEPKAAAVAKPAKKEEKETSSKEEAGVQPPTPEPGPEPEKPAQGGKQEEPKPQPEPEPEPEKPAEASKKKASVVEDVGEAADASESGGES